MTKHTKDQYKRLVKQYAKAFLKSNKKSTKELAMNYAKRLMQKLSTDSSVATLKKQLGISYMLGKNSSSKTEKGLTKNIDTYILYLSASDNAGFDICPSATDECRKLCLVETGRAAMESASGNIHISRLIKTWLYRFNRDVFKKLVKADIQRAINSGNEFCVRLNGTSDLHFSWLIREYPQVQFYDYTKNKYQIIAKEFGNLPQNHHITFSYSGHNLAECVRALSNGLNVAIAVSKDDYDFALSLESAFNGDETDLRYLDKMQGGLCILKIKGIKPELNKFVANREVLEQLNHMSNIL